MRGGSTITQQTAKNLFLWQGRSYVRKALELPLAVWMDLILGKRRIMEIYLNIAELGAHRANSGRRPAPAGPSRVCGPRPRCPAGRPDGGDAAQSETPGAPRSPGRQSSGWPAIYQRRANTAGLDACLEADAPGAEGRTPNALACP